MSDRELVNLTGHPVVFYDEFGDGSVTLYPTDERARVSSIMSSCGTVNVGGLEVPILGVEGRSLYHLPEPDERYLYLVSGLVAGVAKRDDVVAVGRRWKAGGSKPDGVRALLRP